MAKEPPVSDLKHNRSAQLSRLEFMEIGDEDRRLLRELAPVLSPHLDRIIDRWYQFLLTRPETRDLLSKSLIEGHLKRVQTRYFRELLEAAHDETYFAARVRIGLIHHMVGLEPDWYMGAYRKYWDLVQSFLEESGFEERKVVAWTRALQKVMYLDMALALDAYFETYVRDLVVKNEALREAAGELEIKNVELSKRREELEESEHRFRSLVETMNDGLFVLDPEGRITYANDELCEMLGYRREELVGEPVSSFLNSAGGSALRRLLKAEPRSRAGHHELRWKASGGREVFSVVSVAVLRNAGGRMRGCFGVVTDITDRRRMEEDLRRAKEAAESANAAKSEFMAMITHELKNPMNSVIGFTELLLDEVDGPLEEPQRQSLLRIEKNAKHLLRLIEEILDYSKMESGKALVRSKMGLYSLDFSLRDTLREGVAALSAKAKEKGLRLSYRVGGDVPDKLVGDPDRLRQILTNLVENAIKFTESGEIEVYAEREVQRIQRPDRSCLHIGVRDTGVGIPAERQADVFKPFVQLEVNRKRGGLGLGLAISMELIELMEGRVWIDSEVGKGSTFHFTACFGVPRVVAPSIRSISVPTSPHAHPPH